MAIVDELTRLRDDCLASLDSSHNYYSHTKSAWRIVQQVARQGHKITIRNQVTGSTVNELELSGLAQDYVTGYLASATFQNFVAHFEHFVTNLLRIWLTEYPGSLSANQVRFQAVLDAADKNEIVAAVVQKEVLAVAYKRVPEWFGYLEKIAQLGCPTHDQILRLSEIKASRDVLVHSNGIANRIYVEKSGAMARFADGQSLDLPEHYHRESWQLMRQVVSDLGTAGISKLSKK